MLLKRIPSWAITLLSLGLGILAGSLLGEHARWLKPCGDVFIALIRMMVMPVVFVSLVSAVTMLGDMASMRRIACKSLAIYVLTMMLSAALAMALASVFGIGAGIELGGHIQPQTVMPDFSGLMPDNPVRAMANGQVLPVMLFALLFGLAINLSGEAGRPAAQFFETLNTVIFRLIGLLLRVAPLGVFALMAWVTATSGFVMLAGLAALVGTLYLACFLLLTVVYGGLLGLAGLDPRAFLLKMLPAQLFALSTCSSNASLPLTIDAVLRMGVQRNIAAFVLPLGSTINMNGLATYLGAVAVFAANAAGIELSLTQMVIVVLTTSFGAIGAAGVPGTGLVVMSLVLSSVGLPLEVVALVAAVDRIIDMINTPTNISGDALAAVLVAKSEGGFDAGAYVARAG